MGRRVARGGRGSNQYHQNGASVPAARPQSAAEIVAALDTERAAWAFLPARVTEADVTGCSDPEMLVRYAAHESALIRRLVAEHPHTPPGLVGVLAQETHKEVRKAALARADCPTDALASAARGRGGVPADDFEMEVEVVLGNPSTPPASLALAFTKLSEDTRPFRVAAQVKALSGNPTTPSEVLRSLFDWTSPGSNTVLENPSCPPDLLAEKSTDDRFVVPVTKNPNCPPVVLAKIAQTYPQHPAGFHAVKHPACPSDVIRQAAAGGLGASPQSGAAMSEWAAAQPDLIGGLAKAWPESLCAQTSAADPSTDRDLLATLAAHAGRTGNNAMLLSIARNPNTGSSTLASLYAPKVDAKTAVAVMNHPHTPLDILRRGSGDDYHYKDWQPETRKTVNAAAGARLAELDPYR